MEAIQLTLTAQSPLAIGRQKPGGSISEAQDYIPGSVIRGALADLMLSQTQHRPAEALEGDLAALFTAARPAVFTHAYPGSGSKVLPATAFSSKKQSRLPLRGGQNGGVRHAPGSLLLTAAGDPVRSHRAGRFRGKSGALRGVLQPAGV